MGRLTVVFIWPLCHHPPPPTVASTTIGRTGFRQYRQRGGSGVPSSPASALPESLRRHTALLGRVASCAQTLLREPRKTQESPTNSQASQCVVASPVRGLSRTVGPIGIGEEKRGRGHQGGIARGGVRQRPVLPLGIPPRVARWGGAGARDLALSCLPRGVGVWRQFWDQQVRQGQ